MPNRWPIASGNWSNAAIWSGSLIPTASDDVFLNNQVVTLDQNITVLTIRNAATGSVVAGGRLEIYNNYTINCSSIQGTSTSTYLIFNYNTGSTTLNSILNVSSSGLCVDNISTGVINIIGDIFPPNNVGVGNLYSVRNFSNGSINVIGNIQAINPNGGGNGSLNNFQNGIINITGNAFGGLATGNGTSHIILNSSIGTINITGNLIGGSASGGGSRFTVSNNNIGTLNVTGNVLANSGSCILSTTAGIINVIGQIQASPLINAIQSTSTTATNVFSGPFINSGSRNAVYCYNVRMYKNAVTSYSIVVSGSNDRIILLSEDQAPGMPISANVRTGIAYGPTNAITGSMAVPDPRSVSVGVAVDNTVGSALVKPEDLWNVALASLTGSNSIGQRLANVATSASNAAIVNAF